MSDNEMNTEYIFDSAPAENVSDIMIEAKGIKRCFKLGSGEDFYALKGIDIQIPAGKLTILKGRSGSGKTTLLNILSALDEPTEGEIIVDGHEYSQMNEKEKELLRRYNIGFVFQSVALIPIMSAYENVDFGLRLAEYDGNRDARIRQVLELVGLTSRMTHYPNQMSGGEQQRVAIAIALANNPKILLADEPTGAVDTKTSNMIQDLFRKLNEELGITIIIVTHDISLANKVGRVVMIADGKISTEKIMKESYKDRMNELATDGFSSDDSHEEFSILDKANRVQISPDMLAAAGIDSNKVKVQVENGKVIITKE